MITINWDAFEEVDGGTLTVDSVHYRAIGGRLANWLIVEKDLRRIFEYRRRRMLELFPATASVTEVASS